MKKLMFAAGGLALFAAGAAPLFAQNTSPLEPARPRGQGIAPYFEGWYDNRDGTYTFSFGYFNFNTEEVVEIPVGPDNFIEPSEYNGMQSTVFDVSPRRERGTFAVTVPASFAEAQGTVTWTLRRGQYELSVPAYIGVQNHALTHGPMPMGSEELILRFSEDGPSGRGPQGIIDEDVRTVRVGEPLELTAWVTDPSVRMARFPGAPQEGELESISTLTWFVHQGGHDGVTFERDPNAVPAEPEPEPEPAPDSATVPPDSTAAAQDEEEEPPPPNVVEIPVGGGVGRVIARFSKPGDYVLRVRSDSFDHAIDVGASEQCCWTNGYLRVNVTP
jgi:hypothetical protein